MYIRLSGLAVPACNAILSFLDDKSLLLGVSLAICYKDSLMLHYITSYNDHIQSGHLHKKGRGNSLCHNDRTTVLVYIWKGHCI